MLHQLLRYRPVIDILAGGDYGSVLEVGSGSSGITGFMDVRVVGVDIDFCDYTAHRRNCPPNLVPVISGAQNLPFRDGAFDLVFSCDMLEHLPAGARASALSEMIRVADRKVVLVFPRGRVSETLDKALRSACIRLSRPVPGWLEEHADLKLPTHGEIRAMLDGAGFLYRLRGNAFIPLHYITLVMESNPRLRRLLSEVSFTYGRGAAGNVRVRMMRLFASLAAAVSDMPPSYRLTVEIDKHPAV